MSEITLNSLPKTLDELKAMPQAALTVPEEVAALTVAALALYPENPAETEKIAAHKKGISLESKRKRHPGKGRKNHHGIGRCFDARLDMPKAIAKGDDICALRHIKSDDKQGDQ